MHDTEPVRHRSPLRAAALALATAAALSTGLVFTTQTTAHAAPVLAVTVVPAAVSYVLPFATATGGALATGTLSAAGAFGTLAYGAAAAAALAAPWDVSWPFSWGPSAPSTFGDPPSVAVSGSDFIASYTSGTTLRTRYGFTFVQMSGASPVYDVSVVKHSGSDTIFVGRQCLSGGINWTNVAYSSTLVGTVQRKTMNAATSCASPGPDGYWRGDTTTATGTNAGTFVWPTANPTTPPPPADSGTTPLDITPKTMCRDSSGVVTTVAGTILKTTRSTSDPQTLTYPACPAGSAVAGRSAPITRTGESTILGDALTGQLDSSTAWTPPVVPAIYPDCANGTCVMTLTVTDPAGQAQRAIPATHGPAFRTLVKTYPQVGTSAFTGPRQATSGDSFQCKYGPYPVAVAECQIIPDLMVEAPTQTEPSQSNCNLSDFSLNPVSWVVTPLKCLFIPRDSQVQAAAAALSTAWDGTAPAVVVSAAGTVFAPVVALGDVTVGDCQGPPFTFPALAGVTEPFTIHPMSTCNELATYLLGIYLPVATAMTYLGGFFAGTRLLLKSAGAESPVKEA